MWEESSSWRKTYIKIITIVFLRFSYSKKNGEPLTSCWVGKNNEQSFSQNNISCVPNSSILNRETGGFVCVCVCAVLFFVFPACLVFFVWGFSRWVCCCHHWLNMHTPAAAHYWTYSRTGSFLGVTTFVEPNTLIADSNFHIGHLEARCEFQWNTGEKELADTQKKTKQNSTRELFSS